MKKFIFLIMGIGILVFPSDLIADPFYNWEFNLDGYASHTYDYADIVTFDDVRLGFLDSYSWSHYLPAHFNSTTDMVTDAQIWISAHGVTHDYSSIAHIEGIGQWVFLDGQDWQWSWTWGIVFEDQSSETVVGLPTTTENFAFWQQNPINVTVGTGQFLLDVTLDQSVLMMDYGANSLSTASSVPEPTTIALFGLGLLGIGIIRYRRK